MDLIEFRDFCLSMEGVTEKMPFGKFARRYESVLVFYVLDHMFCLTDINDFTNVEIPCTPDEKRDFKDRYTAVSSPLNRALVNWVTLNFDEDMPDAEIYSYVTRAYHLIKSKHTPKPKSTK
ncbi:MAG: MmcQ/YjbR family DNA-binding protein [Paramuribaculum sp.]|nr:MmcQ/YjbR family DNA-binding protein [Paramuribaculum sp.]